MQVRVRLFAALRERAGSDEVQVELPEGARVADVLERLQTLTEGTPVVMAVNQEYADAGSPLHAGDELALIPPVSGGSSPPRSRSSAVGVPHVGITEKPLDAARLVERVRDARAGAVVVFEGVTREVDQLEYQAYGQMAERRIAEIVSEAIERHGLCAAAVEHRVGIVPLSDPSVVVAASAPHREAAFAGAREIIDRTKAEAPIWKKEEGEWVRGAVPTSGR